jgi:hypothetical protein
MKLNELHVGDEGEQVLILQIMLRCMGYCGANGKPLALDKKFQTNTLYAVLRFQEQAIAYGADVGNENNEADGVWGSKCWHYTLGTEEL